MDLTTIFGPWAIWLRPSDLIPQKPWSDSPGCGMTWENAGPVFSPTFGGRELPMRISNAWLSEIKRIRLPARYGPSNTLNSNMEHQGRFLAGCFSTSLRATMPGSTTGKAVKGPALPPV